MKKNIFSLSAIAVTFAVMTGCVGGAGTTQDSSFVEHCEYKTGTQAPEWYCNPTIEGGMAAVGEAKPNVARDNNMQRTMALANGRDELARQTQVKVQNLLTNWSRATGAGDSQTYEANFENISRQISKQTLEGSRQLKRWIAPDGSLVLLIGVTDSAAIKDSVKTSLRNEEALWQQFQAKQSLDELDKQLDAQFQ
ncbi:MAG TPA: LPP20 family lipoprotein [Marinospirillum sp.]|uniref:LPP20 family lipoprotein n=1 Tax=Marinospirillum sp. TaxID=2183934 RepID=UPI002B4704DE|nr:LPP20 family lipoprotein [Marinospirillum sp.]HKM15914.1 LPP20 family lipoprotein [Marinospirillum sp.]